MDTTEFLIKLITEKDQPGGAPLLEYAQLEPVESAIVIKHPELIVHLASAYNEPVVIRFILSRYQFDPNKHIEFPSHIKLGDAPESLMYSTHLIASMFNCTETLTVFLEHHLWPKRWYVLFLFLFVYEEYEYMEWVIQNYLAQIVSSLQATSQNEDREKLAKILSNLTDSTIIKDLYQQLGGDVKK